MILMTDEIDYSNVCPCGNCRRMHKSFIVSWSIREQMTIGEVQDYFKSLSEVEE